MTEIGRLEHVNHIVCIETVVYYCQFVCISIFSLIIGSSEQMENLLKVYDSDTDSVAMSNDLLQKAYNLKHPDRRLAFTKDRLFMYSPVFIFQRKSAMTRLFNEQLQALQEFGLIHFWTKNRINTHEKRSKNIKPSILELKNILAAFQICAVMYSVSFIVFMLEVISVRFQRIKYILDYFTY